MPSRSHETVDRSPLAPTIDEPEASQPPQHLDRRVGAHAQDGEERLPGPIGAEQHHSGTQRPERRPRVEPGAVADGAAGRALGTGKAAQELHLPVALGTGDSDDLALGDLQVDRAESLSSQARHGQEHLSVGPGGLALGKRELKRPPDHEGDQALLGHGRALERPLTDAVAEDRDAVGDAEHLRQAMADVDDADPCPALLEHERVEAFHVIRSEGRRRLVEQEHLRLRKQSLDDLEQLPLRKRQRAGG